MQQRYKSVYVQALYNLKAEQRLQVKVILHNAIQCNTRDNTEYRTREKCEKREKGKKISRERISLQ